jgi:MoaA/NifB/PqqE/SkfB family radical SAM enzyme
MPETQEKKPTPDKNYGHRIDEHFQQLLMTGERAAPWTFAGSSLALPDPVFPQCPEKLGDVEPNALYVPKDGESAYRSRTSLATIRRALRGWCYPYVRSLVMPGELHPLIAYLFTEYKCNLECHYCWAFNNTIKGMSEATARYAIDWLYDNGCRVLALMGGEVLLRPDFVHKVVYYAAKKGFWIYVPTNGRLMRKSVIDRLADAGVATFNLAVDSVADRKELPKALEPIRRNFDYLIQKQYSYGYCVFLNINITRINTEDVKALTEIAHDCGVSTDYHINESPMMEQPDFKHSVGNSTFIHEEDWPQIDAVVDWLIEKSRAGYKMVNSVNRLQEMKAFMRGKVQCWDCRAGQNSIIIRTDGTLAPCFPTYNATYDWGVVGEPRFEANQLKEMKVDCQRHCFSTLNHTLAYCYNVRRVVQWMTKQALNGFQGVTGTFED